MDQRERDEVYERIPWEMLEKRPKDRNLTVIVGAGAVALGAIAFSFMRSQPAPVPETVSTPVATTPVTEPSIPAVSASPAPLVISEADLFAVDPERLMETAATHAELIAVEYFTADPSTAVGPLMPSGVPDPQAPEGTQVYVDWVGATSVTEIGPLSYSVEVAVRSLVSAADAPFVRQPTMLIDVDVILDETGTPHLARPPGLARALERTPSTLTLTALPTEIQTQIETTVGPVVGGEPMSDGRWRVVALATGADGVVRPVTVIAP
jgi:hypothetical protein